jgi:hypothetical protein
MQEQLEQQHWQLERQGQCTWDIYSDQQTGLA